MGSTKGYLLGVVAVLFFAGQTKADCQSYAFFLTIFPLCFRSTIKRVLVKDLYKQTVCLVTAIQGALVEMETTGRTAMAHNVSVR